MKTLEDEWYVAIKAYKLVVFEILGDFFVLSCIACPRYPYIRVYRLYDILRVRAIPTYRVYRLHDKLDAPHRNEKRT